MSKDNTLGRMAFEAYHKDGPDPISWSITPDWVQEAWRVIAHDAAHARAMEALSMILARNVEPLGTVLTRKARKETTAIKDPQVKDSANGEST